MGIDAGNEGRRLYEIEDKKFLKKLFLKIKNPDYLQLIVNNPGFCICMTIAFHDGNKSVFIFMYQSVQKMLVVSPRGFGMLI